MYKILKINVISISFILLASGLNAQNTKVLDSDETGIENEDLSKNVIYHLCYFNGYSNPVTGLDLSGLIVPGAVNIQYNNTCIDIEPEQNSDLSIDMLQFFETQPIHINIIDMEHLYDFIMGNRSWDSELHALSGECSGDSKIGASDLIILQNVILGDPSTLDPGWRFYELSENSPLQLVGGITQAELDESNMTENILVVKKGDINMSFSQGDSLNGQLVLVVKDEIINKGELYDIDFSFPAGTQYRGFQIEFPSENQYLSNIHYQIDDPLTLISGPGSLFSDKVVILNFETNFKNEVLFRIQFIASENGILSEMLQLFPENNNIAIMPMGEYPREIVLQWEDKILSSNDNYQTLDVRLYPSPVQDVLYIEGLQSDTEFQIIDMLGRICETGVLQSNAELNVQHLSEGIYVLILESNEGKSQPTKFIVAN